MGSGRRAGQTFKMLMELQRQARVLIEVEGKTQREVAKMIDIGESTLSEWATKFNWISLRKAELLKLQKQCKSLIEVEGLNVNEAAEITKVSSKTISQWIATLNWQKVDELAIKCHNAKKLLTERGFNQKEVSLMVEVSEKTIGTWVKKYKWKTSKKTRKEQRLPQYEFATGFKQHAMLFAPRNAEKICLLVDDYLNSLNT